jgi:hypothetical protein
MKIISLPLSQTFSPTYISAQNININSTLIQHCDVTISYFQIVPEPNVSGNMNVNSPMFQLH